MNKYWFCSDLHFFHRNIVKYTNRGVETTQEEHDDWLIELWNKTVHASDIVVHLGDFSFAKNGMDSINLLKRLNGRKILLKGNHDYSKNFNEYARVNAVEIHHYLENRFTLTDGTKQDICMFHFPIGSWHKQSHGSWHLHGHSHGGYQDSRGKMLDVGIDNAYNMYGEHKFFDLEMISNHMETRERYTADAHRENL